MSQTGSRARTLADQLRGWPEERLAHLLRERPDLATPAPRDSAQLASRAGTRASVQRALDLLDHTELLVLDAIVVTGPVDAADLAEVVNADPGSTAAATERLLQLGLVWESSAGLRALSVVADSLARGGSGVRPRSAVPAPTAAIEAAISAVSGKARALLDHVDTHGGEGSTGTARRNVTPDRAATPVEELLAHGLLQPRGENLLVVPGEVALVLRGGRTTREPVDEVPALATGSRDPAMVARAAAGAAFEAVRRTELLLDHWSTMPPRALRNGGLGVRDLRAAATLLHTDESATGLIIEVAAAAGLLDTGKGEDGEAAWLPTEGYDAWSARSLPQRWLALATAWLELDRAPSRIGERDQSGKSLNALVPELVQPLTTDARHAALGELATLPEGTDNVLAAGTGTPSLVRRIVFRRPRRARSRTELAPAALAEAALLGVTGLDGMPEHGRLLLAGGHADATAALAPLLPEPVDHVLVQADLTAVAPGPLESELARRLQLLADVESRGGATVYRFTPGSVRRALDVGWTGSELHEFLDRVSRTPVPQALTYLVDDAVRTFGSVRVGSCEAFLRSDDEAALAELLHDPRATSLGLRRLAPTVLVSATPLGVLLPRLRELGSAPVVEAADGTVQVARPDLLRARRPRSRRTPGLRRARDGARVASVVSAIRAGDRAAATAPHPTDRATGSPTEALAALREAVEEGGPVVVEYVDNHGTTTDRVVAPRRVEGGRLTAYDERTETTHTFAVHRITAVRPLPAR